MVTVGADARVVERRLAAGRLRCPACSGRAGGVGACPPAGDPGSGRDWLAALSAQVAVRGLRGYACAAAGELPAAAGGRGGGDLGGAGRQGRRGWGTGRSRPAWAGLRRRCGTGWPGSPRGPGRSAGCSRCGCARLMRIRRRCRPRARWWPTRWPRSPRPPWRRAAAGRGGWSACRRVSWPAR